MITFTDYVTNSLWMVQHRLTFEICVRKLLEVPFLLSVLFNFIRPKNVLAVCIKDAHLLIRPVRVRKINLNHAVKSFLLGLYLNYD